MRKRVCGCEKVFERLCLAKRDSWRGVIVVLAKRAVLVRDGDDVLRILVALASDTNRGIACW